MELAHTAKFHTVKLKEAVGVPILGRQNRHADEDVETVAEDVVASYLYPQIDKKKLIPAKITVQRKQPSNTYLIPLRQKMNLLMVEVGVDY